MIATAQELLLPNTGIRLPQSQIDAWRPDNPHVLLADANKCGYVVMDIDAHECRAHLRGIDDEKVRDRKSLLRRATS